MTRSMGIPFNGATFKKKNRWVFIVSNLIDADNFQTGMLPPSTAARPSLTFKEIQIEHLTETISIPGKPEWGMLEVTLYDIQCRDNPLFKWLKKLYDPSTGAYRTLVGKNDQTSYKIPYGCLRLLNGCGDILESWIYEGLWVQKIDWGNLDMSSGDVVMVDVVFKYDRAYQFEGTCGSNNSGPAPVPPPTRISTPSFSASGARINPI